MEYSFKPTVENSSNSKVYISTDDTIIMEFNKAKNDIKFHGYGEMCKFVKMYLGSLLTSAIDKNPRALQIITDKELLTAMSISSDIELNKDQINRFNRVFRAYVINPAKNVIYNQSSAHLLYKLASKINKDLIDSLMSINLPEDNALWIAVNRFSSTDERRNIRRMVRAMQHVNPSIMTEQMAINVFSKTFNDQFTNLFIAVMTDRFDAFESEQEKYVYSTISNAILDILNSMDDDDIKDIITEYEIELKRSGVSGRFSLKAINSGDYKAICDAVEELMGMGLYID